MIDEPAAPPEVLAAIRAPFAALKATAIDPPVIQPLSLLLDLAGEKRAAIHLQHAFDILAMRLPDFGEPQ